MPCPHALPVVLHVVLSGVHLPPSHFPPQHCSFEVQASLSEVHCVAAHLPPIHARVQHSVGTVHAAFAAEHDPTGSWHVPFSHRVEQHCVPAVHAPPVAAQVALPSDVDVPSCPDVPPSSPVTAGPSESLPHPPVATRGVTTSAVAAVQVHAVLAIALLPVVKKKERCAQGGPASGNGGPPRPHVPVHVVPAAHVSEVALHLIVHAVDPPHSTVQPALPPHSAVQPPSGHLIVHVLLPSHESVEPAPSVIVHLLPPVHVAVLFVPVSIVHSLVPAQLVVQLASQLPSHFDWPAQLLVQFVPHVRSHVFCDSQLNVTLSGAPLLLAVPPPSGSDSLALLPPPAGAPNVHVPPFSHSHVEPVQMQSPTQDGLAIAGASSPPHPTTAPSDAVTMERTTRAAASKRMRRTVLISNQLKRQIPPLHGTPLQHCELEVQVWP